MDQPLLAFAIKLPLALAVFLLIAYAGTANKRIAGVLLTFPILNGVAIITAADPIVVADAIYPLVIFNCVLFALVISFPHALPPADASSRSVRLLTRVVVWSLAWFIGAWLITDFRAAIPGGGILLPGATLFALVFMMLAWTKQSSGVRDEAYRWDKLVAFWATRAGLTRVMLFVLAYAVLFFAARVALDEKWVGMASALPLPGLFALAALIDDLKADAAIRSALLPMRDTVFLGPVLVIPFNWTFSHLLAFVLPPGALVHYALLFALWAGAALLLLLVLPRLAARLDR